MDASKDTTPDFGPAKADENGVTFVNDYPLNNRLRAEAMARDGVEHDPDELISDELIASTKDRLALEDADEAKAKRAEKPVERMNLVELQAEATRLTLAFEPSATKADLVNIIQGATAAPASE